MKNNSSFPHPVLGVNKGILPDLEPNNAIYERTESDSEYIYTITLNQQDKQILGYIKDGFAIYVCEIDCRSTLYKSKVESSQSTFEVRIPKLMVSGHIDFNCYVVTTKIFPNYRNDNFNPDYRDPVSWHMPSFYLEKGSVLVVFQNIYDNISIDYDNKISLAAFMQVVKGDDDLEHCEFDISRDIIDIILPPKQFEIFHDHNDEACLGIFATSIINNALVYAILHIDESDGRIWADSIKARMETEKSLSGYDIENPKDAIDIAFNLLSHKKFGDPYDLLFESINKLTEED